MRWDRGTLRVICLVASAVSAGYLWRAALEDDPELGRLLDTSPPATVQPGAAPPASVPPIRTAQSPDRALAAERRGAARADPVRSKPAARRQKQAKSVLVVNRPARPVAAPTRGEVSPGPAEKQPKRPKGSPGVGGKTGAPKIPGGLREEPPTGKSGPAGGSPPPTEGTSTPLTSDPSPGEPSELPAPPSLTPPAEPEETPPATQALLRPGWGHGDENHDHAGPPGQAKKGGPRT